MKKYPTDTKQLSSGKPLLIALMLFAYASSQGKSFCNAQIKWKYGDKSEK